MVNWLRLGASWQCQRAPGRVSGGCVRYRHLRGEARAAYFRVELLQAPAAARSPQKKLPRLRVAAGAV